MKHLFSPEGRAALQALLGQAPLLAFDFDGTLAPIVARPDDAHVPPAVASRLDRLGRYLPVAIITGRSVDDVRTRLDFEPRFVIGNHGAEDPLAPTPAGEDAADVAVLEPLRERLRGEAAALQSVEDKRHSVALHYRLAADRDRAHAMIGTVMAGLGPAVRVFGGKLVANAVAARAPDKAGAMASLVVRTGATHALFVGDDVNDEPVFARAEVEPGWLTVRVGRDDPGSRALFFLDSSAEVAVMLHDMLVLLEPGG
jgi:trehalose 6-phosphate phosphatase